MKSSFENVAKAVEDIKSMRVRGASVIARYALESIQRDSRKILETSRNKEEFLENFEAIKESLLKTRPTAIALPNALKFIEYRLKLKSRNKTVTKNELYDEMVSSIDDFLDRIKNSKKEIAMIFSNLVKTKVSIMTHCHSSTVVEVIKKINEDRKVKEVYVTETRPLYQGYITAKKLRESNVNVKLIVDSASGTFMKNVDLVLVGADAIALNGDVINKIGTYPIAVVAKEENKKFFVTAESYKIATNAKTGKEITIEYRSTREVYNGDLRRLGNPEILNPSFDVTPAKYVTAVITELGVVKGKQSKKIKEILRKARYV
ncbi:MAG: translation initiation factor eIF-2B [Thermoproteota archaeon]|jgi:ribose 1,5-bisphosphate isomerase